VQLSSPLGWKNVPLKTLLASKFNCAVEVYTTKVRLLAEMSIQPLLESQNIVYLNVANGVGTTVVVDGRLIHGSTHRCGELGHVVIDSHGPVCGCGQRGCLEAHISGPAILNKIRHDLSGGVQSVLSKLLKETDTPEEMAEHWKLALDKEDPYAMQLRDFVGDKLSRAAAIAINLFDPDVLILAGYVNEIAADYFADAIKKRFETDVYDQSSRKIEIMAARAGQQALIRGVAAAVFEKQFS
jgi:predicted NBD/HSP70 family sugar kinase